MSRIITKIKNTIEGLNSRLILAGETINRSIETMYVQRKNSEEKWTKPQINVGNRQVLKPTCNGSVERIRDRGG